MQTPIVIIEATIFILVAESMMWWLFRRKVAGLLLPVEVDKSVFRIATPRFLGIVAVVHTLLLLLAVDLTLFFTW